jgi:hypothetical protein
MSMTCESVNSFRCSPIIVSTIDRSIGRETWSVAVKFESDDRLSWLDLSSRFWMVYGHPSIAFRRSILGLTSLNVCSREYLSQFIPRDSCYSGQGSNRGK